MPYEDIYQSRTKHNYTQNASYLASYATPQRYGSKLSVDHGSPDYNYSLNNDNSSCNRSRAAKPDISKIRSFSKMVFLILKKAVSNNYQFFMQQINANHKVISLR
jgi:hypothetical protein